MSYAGRSLQKHGDRAGSPFPQIKGSPELRNSIGQLIVDDILTNPGSTFKNSTWVENGVEIGVIEATAPSGGEIRFRSVDGSFVSFLSLSKKP